MINLLHFKFQLHTMQMNSQQNSSHNAIFLIHIMLFVVHLSLRTFLAIMRTFLQVQPKSFCFFMVMRQTFGTLGEYILPNTRKNSF